MSLTTTLIGAALALVRPTRDETPATPAADALREHLEKCAIGRAQIHAENVASTARAAKADEVNRLRAGIDKALEQQRYYGTEVDIKGQQRALIAAERELAQIKPGIDVTVLATEIRRLDGETLRLVHAEVIESMAADREEFEAVERAYRAVHRKVFTKATAADRLATQNGFGVFVGSALYAELHVTRPATYQPSERHYEAEAAAVREDLQQLERDADALVQALLNEPTGG